ncbi:DUF317 domain-containing protein [Streptomyces sp. B1866]|uniref:DUF317 domain-containing protein n=1 Tax=Streptomyces sp. B1866 TaxID=3075431 RepID=UPI00288C6AF1|nr:DUF317 domain-containing protein [Streptomyces sp. B1866]MDT3395315.1 DUF317 domain-containing protein [Streptomyces sp. B1866]
MTSTTHLPPTTSAPGAAPPAPADERGWLLGDGCGEPVLAVLHDHGWAVVSDDLANVHCASPDGRAYVGFLPETPDHHRHGVLWRVTVNAPDGSTGWTQTFGSNTPAEAIAGFLTALITTPRRARD